MGCCTGNSFVQLEERITDAEPGRPIVDDAELLIAGMQVEPVVFLGDIRSGFGNRFRQVIGAGRLFNRAQPAFKSLPNQASLIWVVRPDKPLRVISVNDPVGRHFA